MVRLAGTFALGWFIGRMVGEKGSDLLPDAYRNYIHAGGSACFLVLGTGEAWTQNEFRAMSHQYPGRVNAVIDYNEALAHQIYAGSDFLDHALPRGAMRPESDVCHAIRHHPDGAIHRRPEEYRSGYC